MMRKLETIEGFEVYTSEANLICIKQEGLLGNEDSIILIHPSQVDTLVKWLIETRDEMADAE